jgi:nucleotide-binding universal stress UspA family protein
MKKAAQEKILVPVDGSDRAIDTVKYIARNKAFHPLRIVLFHVFSAVPESYWDMENNVRSRAIIKEARAWESSQRKLIGDHMQRAKGLLEKSGIPETCIQMEIQNRRRGIARDIIREARNGYTAVVTRRRGITGLRGVALGSVATKLLAKIVFTPLILVGKKSSNRRILVGYDGSEDALRAVNFAGATLAGLDYEIELLHVIRGNDGRSVKVGAMAPSKEFTCAAEKEMTSSFRLAKEKLIGFGFAPKAITTKILMGKSSRAKAIADEARQYDFGTIVMGRKGRSRVREFFIGRVTNKVIHMARDRSVWIIP